MNINRKYGKLNNGSISYAPQVIVLNGTYNLSPSEQDYLNAGWMKIIDESPAHEDGFSIVSNGWEERDGCIFRTYERVESAPSPVFISKSKVEKLIDEMGKTDLFFSWINSKASHFGGWMRGRDVIQYDPVAHEGELASLITALEIPADAVAELMAKVVA